MEFIQVGRNVQETIALIVNHPGCSIGFEVIEKSVIEALTINIDPQHTGVKFANGKVGEIVNKSASKWVLNNIYGGFPCDDDIMVFPNKLDLDCIVAGVLYQHKEDIIALENAQNTNDGDTMQCICDIVNRIDVVDCGLGNIDGVVWNPNHQKQQLLSEITWYQILSAFIADFKVPLVEKITKVWQWLNDGVLAPFENWERNIRREALEQKQSRIDEIYGVTVVESHARGATGLIYANAPFGVAFNSRFPVKDGTIAKFTICQFTADKYIDLAAILAEISELEQGWGGNITAGIIGSPFGGTNLGVQQVAKIVSRHVK